MAKKTFSKGLEALIPLPQNKKTQVRENSPAPVKTTPKAKRATFIVEDALVDKLKAIAYWERLQIKELIGTILQEAITKYEKNKGKIKPIPTKR